LGINNNNKGTIMSETGMIWIGGAIFAGILFFGGIQVGRGLSSGDGSLDMGESEFRKHQARTIKKESIDILRRAEARMRLGLSAITKSPMTTVRLLYLLSKGV